MSHRINIVTPPESHALTTLDAVKTRLNISGSTYDAALTDEITRASAVIEAFIGRPVLSMTVAERWRTLINQRRDALVLAYQNISAVNSITEDDSDLTVDTDYDVELATRIIYRVAEGRRWIWGYQVDVEYVTGWETVPADIEAVCIDLVQIVHTRGASDPSVQLEVTEGVGRTAYFNRPNLGFVIDESMRQVLMPYADLSA